MASPRRESELTSFGGLVRWLAQGVTPRPGDTEDARALAKTAREQGLTGLLDEALGGDPEAAAAWPPEVLSGLRSAHRGQLVQVLHRLTIASDLQRALLAAGLRSLALKGAALADTLYASPSHRTMDDVDVLVLDDFGAARGVVEGLGYEAAVEGTHAWGFQQIASRDPGGPGTEEPASRHLGLFVELHATVVSASAAFRIDHEGLWARSRLLGDPPRRVPSIEDLTVLSALHLTFQHALDGRLGQWLDLRRLLEHPELDAHALVQRANEWGAGAALGLALVVAGRLVGAKAPPLATSALPAPRSLLRRMEAFPSSPPHLPLALTRWRLCRGRRLAFLLDTLAPRRLGAPPGSARPLLSIPKRLLRLGSGLALRRTGRC